MARAREVAEHLGGAAVAGGIEEQEAAVGVVELEQRLRRASDSGTPAARSRSISSSIACALAA